MLGLEEKKHLMVQIVRNLDTFECVGYQKAEL